MKLRIILVLVATASATLFWWWNSSSGQTITPTTEESETPVRGRFYSFREIAHGRTKPIREIAKQYAPRRGAKPHGEDELGPVPKREYALQADGALQTRGSGPFSATIGLNFDGLSATGFYPADPNGAVGTTQYVEVVNNEYGVYDKTSGTAVMPATLTTALFSSIPDTQCQNINSVTDVTITFDKLAQRWVIQQLVKKAPFYICVAVSTSNDATGPFNAYDLAFGSNYFADYVKLGVWPVAYPGLSQGVYLLTANSFLNAIQYVGPVLCFMDRNAMLAGSAANQSQCYGLPPNFNPLLPADLDGLRPPPLRAPGIFMTFDPNGHQVDLIKWTPCYPSCSIPSARPIEVPPFTPYFAIAGHGPNCTFNGATNNGPGQCDIPEASGDGTYLDSQSIKPMYRLAYRTGGHLEFLTFTHTVLGVVNGTNQVAAVRWYEIRDPNTRPFYFQAGTFAPDYQWRWMGSTAMDGFGDQAIGYSLSPTQLTGHPGPMLAITGRTPSDNLNEMENEYIVISNNFYQNSGQTRWGDYSSMQVDPVDDCTFWYTGEYVKQSGPSNWGTYVVTFKFPSCP